jgi:hypothetical protein
MCIDKAGTNVGCDWWIVPKVEMSKIKWIKRRIIIPNPKYIV